MAIVVPIAADYDASGVKKAERDFSNFGQSISRSLQQAAQAAKKSFDAVENGAQDSRTAAQRLAAQITTTAQTLDTQLAKSEAAAQALASALGPEFVARVGKGGVNRLITDLNRAGLSMAEITTEASTLAAAIAQVDAVNLSHVTAEAATLGNAVEATTNQVNDGRQVMSSFAGQASAELANIGGPIGAVASGMGQIVTQAVAGRLSLVEFGTAIGPMVALSAVLLGIKSVFDDLKKAKAWNKEQLKAYTDALRDTASVSTVVRDRIDEIGGAFVQVNKSRERFSPGWFFHLPTSKDVKDITADLVALGLTSKDIAKFVAAGKPKVDEYIAALKDAGASGTSLSLVQKYLYQQIEQTGNASAAAAIKTQFGVGATIALASAMDTTAIAAGAAAVAMDVKAKADEAAAAAAEAAAKADRAHANSIDAVRESLYKRNNARYAATDADRNARTALEEYAKAQAKADKTGKAKDIAAAAEAAQAAERAVNQAAAAYDNLAGEQYKYASETDKANARTRAARDELGRLGETIKPGSELYRTLQTWIFLLGKIPASITTSLGIDFGSAIKAPPATSGAGMPGVSGQLGNWTLPAGTGNNAATSITNITINGAVDKVGTARQIQELQNKDSQRQGLS